MDMAADEVDCIKCPRSEAAASSSSAKAFSGNGAASKKRESEFLCCLHPL